MTRLRAMIIAAILVASNVMAVDVTNEADLQACYLDATEDYTLTADITITTNFASFMISGYTGTFDGGGYTISDFQYSASSQYAGLISEVSSGGVVKDLTIEATLCENAAAYTGILIGRSSGGDVRNVTVSGDVRQTSGDHTGGVAGGAISSTYFGQCRMIGGSVTNTAGDAGALCGYADSSTFETCGVVNATVHVPSGNGGLLCGAFRNDTMYRCYATNSILRSNTYAGGFTAQGLAATYRECLIRDCEIYPVGSGQDYAGGFFGRQQSGNVYVYDCYADLTAFGTSGAVWDIYATPGFGYSAGGTLYVYRSYTRAAEVEATSNHGAIFGRFGQPVYFYNCIGLDADTGLASSGNFAGNGTAGNYDTCGTVDLGYANDTFADGNVTYRESSDSPYYASTHGVYTNGTYAWSTDTWTWSGTDMPELTWWLEFTAPAATGRRRVITTTCNGSN